MAATPRAKPLVNAYTAGRLPAYLPWLLLVGSLLLSATLFLLIWLADPVGEYPIAGAVFVGVVAYGVSLYALSRLVEGARPATNRLVTTLVVLAFVIALLPLISLLFTVVTNGLARFDPMFFTYSMRNIVGEGGGALHAIVGTLLMTGAAAIISIPIGLMTAVYLAEYGRGALARTITFFVDVMTGIPSIVAGLFAFALFSFFFGPGVRVGIAGSIALAVLMIPVVVRTSEEMLRLVPNELREASYALGVPKWRTIVKIVIPTSIAGITTGVMLAIARVIGETAPLLVAAGFTTSMNYDLFDGRMQSLPVFVYSSYVSQGTNAIASLDRAWAGALTLVLIVMLLNLVARLVARAYAPKTRR
jgi:phosphate transport system permease protein